MNSTPVIKTKKRLYLKYSRFFSSQFYTEYTTFKQRYISIINLLLLIKTKLKCNKIKVLTLNKKIQI